MADCGFCPPAGRRFRTPRQCSACSRSLCLVCRPEIPGQPFLCPDCGGGPVEDALHRAGECIARLTAAGQTIPFWLEVLHTEAAAAPVEGVDELIVPE